MKLRIAVTALFCVLALPPIAHTQSTDAVVSGTVIDPDGAVVPNATVTAENVKTGVVATTKTNHAGIYLFAALPPGTYRVKTEHSGFQAAVYDNLQVEVGAQLTVNMSLKVGKTTESVVVQAFSEQLETTTSTVGNVITTQKLLDLPLVGRNAYDLISTQAGTGGAGGQNFNGLHAGALNLTLDGTIVRDDFTDQLAASSRAETVSVDRVAEVRIITSPADAEYGRGSGQIQMISRSGTNRFHGSLFEEHRDTDLTANDWFNNQLGTNLITGQPYAPRNFLIRNQFGGRIGGPDPEEQNLLQFRLRRFPSGTAEFGDERGLHGHRTARHLPLLPGRAQRQRAGGSPHRGYERQSGDAGRRQRRAAIGQPVRERSQPPGRRPFRHHWKPD